MITGEKALACHAEGRLRKLKVTWTRPTEIQGDRIPTCSPGVAAPCPLPVGKPLMQGKAVRARILPST